MISGKDFDRFSSVEELKNSIDMGLDIVFRVGNTTYNISWNYRPYIAVCPDGEADYYKSVDDLLNNHAIDGKPLNKLWQDMEIISM